MRQGMITFTRFILIFLLLAVGATGASAATIAGPSTSTDGNFTLSWPSGYGLRLEDADWMVTPWTSTTSYAFSSLPSGTYKFRLYYCTFNTATLAFECSIDAASSKTVTVTRDSEPSIDTATTAAGSTTVAAGVSRRGSANLSIPLNILPLLNGAGLNLSLQYDSAREFDRKDNHITNDTLGYGWSLSGLSTIQRCQVGVVGGYSRLCLDGEPLIAVSGAYDGDNTEYRTERQSFIKVIQKGFGSAAWFEVRYPDGRIGTFDVKVVPSGFGSIPTAREPYIWAVRRIVASSGDEWNASYDIVDGYGDLRPKEITYADAKIEFKYGPRTDYGVVSYGTNTNAHRRLGLLNRIFITQAGKPVREYRLDSNPDAGGRQLLQQVQECGYARDAAPGSTATCLKPLVISWSTLSGQGTEHYPVAISTVTDGLGAQTQFVWNATTASSNPLAYSESSSYDGPLPSGLGATQTAIVQQLKTSDGLGGWHTLDYRYRGLAQRSTSNRGLIGFQGVRVQDLTTSWFTYTQQRLDWPLAGAVSQVTGSRYAYGTPGNTDLSYAEIGYTVKSLFGGTVQLPYAARTTTWHYEQGSILRVSKTIAQPCFRVLNGDGSCPTSGTESEYFTSMATATTDGYTHTSPAFTPTVWGDVPDRTISNRLQVQVQSSIFNNTTAPWILNLPASTAVRTEQYTPATDAFVEARTVSQSFAYVTNTNLLQSTNAFVGASGLQHTLTYAYQLNGARQQVASETIAASNITTRGVSFTERTTDGRVITDVLLPLSQTTTASPAGDVDNRFATLYRQNDQNSRPHEAERDAFGRVIRTKDEVGNEVATTYMRCDVAGSNCPTITGATLVIKVSQVATNNSVGSYQIAPARNTYLDVLGREILTEVQAFNSSTTRHRVRTAYDTWGRVQYVTKPFLSSGTALSCTAAGASCTWNTYGDPVSSRMTRQDRPDGSFTTWGTPSVSSGVVWLSATETILAPSPTSVTTTKRSGFDLLGRLQTTQDAYGSTEQVTTQYAYDAHSNLTFVSVDDKVVARMTYDAAGNLTQLFDSNFGATDTSCTPTTGGCYWSYTYNALGQLTSMTDAIGQVTNYTYDDLGRLTSRVDRANSTPATHTWTWDPQYAIGSLASRTSPGFSQSYTYESTKGVPLTWSTTINPAGVPAVTVGFRNWYDSAWRLTSVRRECSGCVSDQPSSGPVTRNFTPQGHLAGYTSGATWLQSVAGTDAFGNVTLETYGNGLQTARGYDANTGRLTSIQTGTSALPTSVQNLLYVWRSDGSLYQRKDMKLNGATGAIDTFTYDALARVTSQATNVAAGRTLTFSYDKHGNLTGKANPLAGDLSVTGQTYPSANTRPQRLSQVTIGGIVNTLKYDANGSIYEYTAASGDQLFIEYDGDRRATRITKGTTQGTSTPTARDEFWYDANGDRFLGRQSWMESGSLRTQYTYYLGHLELVYEGGNNVSHQTQHSDAIRFVVTPTIPAGRIEYVHDDHLGSNTVTTTDAGAVVGVSMSFDPFGGRRAANWQSDATSAEMTAILSQENERTGDGFTGHEHLNRTGLIHMNGRVYDPRIGRFLSRDPVVVDVENSQAWNRYSYVLNNPLSYTDPTGYVSEELKKAVDGGTGGGSKSGGRIGSSLGRKGVSATTRSGYTVSVSASGRGTVSRGGATWEVTPSRSGSNGYTLVTGVGTPAASPVGAESLGGAIQEMVVSSTAIAPPSRPFLPLKTPPILETIFKGLDILGWSRLGPIGLGACLLFCSLQDIGEEPSPPPKLNEGQQGKHVPGHNNYEPGRSIITDGNPQGLLDEGAGTGVGLNDIPVGEPGSRERVNFGRPIGIFVDQDTGDAAPTSNGIIHYGSRGAHIVPSRP